MKWFQTETLIKEIEELALEELEVDIDFTGETYPVSSFSIHFKRRLKEILEKYFKSS